VETVALGGDSRLGGDDFDDALAQWFEESFFDQQQAQQTKTARSSRSSSGTSRSSDRQKKINKEAETVGAIKAGRGGVGVLRSGVERWRLLDAAEECRVVLSSDTEVCDRGVVLR